MLGIKSDADGGSRGPKTGMAGRGGMAAPVDTYTGGPEGVTGVDVHSRVRSGSRHVGHHVAMCRFAFGIQLHPGADASPWGRSRGPRVAPGPDLPIQIDTTLYALTLWGLLHVVCLWCVRLSICIVVSRNRHPCCDVNRVSRSRCGCILVEVKTWAIVAISEIVPF